MTLRTRAPLIATIAVLLCATALHAHDRLVRATPAPDARVAAAPTAMRLTFTNPVAIALAHIALRHEDGTGVALGPLAAHPDSANVVIAPIVDVVRPGRYEVSWRIAGADGHPVSGHYAFVVLRGAAADVPPVDSRPAAARTDRANGADTAGTHVHRDAPPDEATRAPLPVFVRWLGLTAILGVIGTVGLRFLVVERTRTSLDGSGDLPAGLERRAASLGIATATMAAVALIGSLLLQAASFPEAGASPVDRLPAIMLHSRWGFAWLVQGASIIVAALGFVLVPRTRAAWWIAAAGACGLAASLALAGHSAAPPRLPAATLVAEFAHVIAVGGWIGTLGALLLVAMPLVRRLPAPRRGHTAAGLVSAFSPAALTFAGVALLTGIFASGIHLGFPPPLTSTAYGRTLLLKLGAFTVLAILGAWNFRRARGTMLGSGNTERFSRVAGLELVVGLIVLLVTALLVATPAPGH